MCSAYKVCYCLQAVNHCVHCKQRKQDLVFRESALRASTQRASLALDQPSVQPGFSWVFDTMMPLTAGHPEFSTDFMEALVRWKAHTMPDSVPSELAERALQQLRQDSVTSKDAAAWHHLCRTFLQGPAPNGVL